MSQVQCPNCGGYKNTGEKKLLNSRTKQVTNDLGFGAHFLAFIGTAILVSIPVLSVTNSPILSIALGIVAGVILLILGDRDYKNRIKQGKLIPILKCNCHLCGYRWDWKQGDPWPEVNVRPELIVAGEIRLQEEAERKRREEELAHLAQHNLNK